MTENIVMIVFCYVLVGLLIGKFTEIEGDNVETQYLINKMYNKDKHILLMVLFWLPLMVYLVFVKIRG